MAGRTVPLETRLEAARLIAQGVGCAQVAATTGLSMRTIERMVANNAAGDKGDWQGARYDDKRTPPATYDEYIANARINKAFLGRTGWSQKRVGIDLRSATEPKLILGLSDTHFGAHGCDMDTLDRFTQFVVKMNGRVLVALVGDLVNLAIKMRGVAEVKGDLWDPERQHAFVGLWLEKIAPFVLCAGWGNHDVEREEAGSGASLHRYIMGRAVPWFDGIGRCDLHLGAETYTMAISHRFKGSGVANVTRGQKQYMKEHEQDVELAIAGDLHQPAVEQVHFGKHHRVAINLGSLLLESGFAQRYFAPRTEPIFPCVEVYPDRHLMNAYWSVNHWLQAKGLPLEHLEPRTHVDYSVS